MSSCTLVPAQRRQMVDITVMGRVWLGPVPVSLGIGEMVPWRSAFGHSPRLSTVSKNRHSRSSHGVGISLNSCTRRPSSGRKAPLQGGVSEMDAMLRAHWLPIFQRCSAQSPEPKWEYVEHHFGDFVPSGAPMDFLRLTSELLWSTLERVSTKASIGADVWSFKDLRRL